MDVGIVDNDAGSSHRGNPIYWDMVCNLITALATVAGVQLFVVV